MSALQTISDEPFFKKRLFEFLVWLALSHESLLTTPPYSVTAQLFVIHPWHFDMDINAVKQGTGDALSRFKNIQLESTDLKDPNRALKNFRFISTEMTNYNF